MTPISQHHHRRTVIIFVFLLAIVAGLALAGPGWTHVRATSLLLRVQNPKHPGKLAELTAHPFEEVLTDVPTPSGPIRARLYIPKDRPHAPGVVLVHGIHHLGIEEPRLVAFARALSSSGIRVLTPEISSLADYRVEGSAVDLIGYSARTLSASVGQKVGIMGLSFAGGLSLLTAADPKFEPCIRFVVSIGAHDDLLSARELAVLEHWLRDDLRRRLQRRLLQFFHALGGGEVGDDR